MVCAPPANFKMRRGLHGGRNRRCRTERAKDRHTHQKVLLQHTESHLHINFDYSRCE